MHKKRIDAINAGAMYYNTGKKCKYGHLSKRITLDGSCYECRMVNQKEQRDKIKQIRENAIGGV